MKRIPMIGFEVQLEPNYKFFASLGFFPPKRLINSDLMPVSDELITDYCRPLSGNCCLFEAFKDGSHKILAHPETGT